MDQKHYNMRKRPKIDYSPPKVKERPRRTVEVKVRIGAKLQIQKRIENNREEKKRNPPSSDGSSDISLETVGLPPKTSKAEEYLMKMHRFETEHKYAIEVPKNCTLDPTDEDKQRNSVGQPAENIDATNAGCSSYNANPRENIGVAEEGCSSHNANPRENIDVAEAECSWQNPNEHDPRPEQMNVVSSSDDSTEHIDINEEDVSKTDDEEQNLKLELEDDLFQIKIENYSEMKRRNEAEIEEIQARAIESKRRHEAEIEESKRRNEAEIEELETRAVERRAYLSKIDERITKLKMKKKNYTI